MNTRARPGPLINTRVRASVAALAIDLAMLALVNHLATDMEPTAALLARAAATQPTRGFMR